jgi:hypothetical protein
MTMATHWSTETDDIFGSISPALETWNQNIQELNCCVAAFAADDKDDSYSQTRNGLSRSQE